MIEARAAAVVGPLKESMSDAESRTSGAPKRIVTVSLMTSGAAADRRLAGSVLAHVGHSPGTSGIRTVLGVLPWADVLLVLAAPLTDDVLTEMAAATEQAENPHQGMVLVTGSVLPNQLRRVAACGVVTILPAHPSTPDGIVEALLASAGGSSDPAVPAPRRPTMELNAREAEVLRLLADGHATNEIAERLHYSERTIKKDLHELMSRLRLRNRTHAVAQALRASAI